MTTIRARMMRYPAPTYFALTFALSWGGVLIVVGPDGIPGTSEQLETLFPFAFVAMLVGPSVAGVVLTGLVHGKAGFRDVLSRLLEWRVAPQWYAVALLTAPVLMTATLFALSLTSPAFLPGVLTASDKATVLLLGLAVALGAGVFEELGWTGFAIPTLRRRYGVLTTGLIVGVFWGAWHLLTNVLWASGSSAGDLSMSLFLGASVVSLLVGALPAYRVLMVWVYDRTESLLVAMLMHVSLTASTLILMPHTAGVALVTYDLTLGAVLWVVVAAVTVANRRHLSRHALQTRVA